MAYIHMINNYDLEERAKAFWEGHQVQFTTEELESLKVVEGLETIYENSDNVHGDFAVVQWKPGKSGWEDLFK